jgi:RimJ/RimL family protein N-acetyltransferase
MIPFIRTARLALVPATREILNSDRDDRHELARLLVAEIPAAWPPALMDETVIREFIRMSTDPGCTAFAVWYWVRDEPGSGPRTLIGSGGVVSSERDRDTVVLGYSVLDAFQNRGFASEAVHALVPAILSLPGTSRIIATTEPDHAASIRVLEKNGFVKTGGNTGGSGAEEGSVWYALSKPR